MIILNWYFYSDQKLACLVRDDLGKCLILLSSRRDLPISIFQSVLSLFSFVKQLMGPTARILVECFMRYVYIKAILQIRSIFACHDESMRALTIPATNQSSQGAGVAFTDQTSLGAVVAAAGLSENSGSTFRIDELEIIFESFADLLSDCSFLPSLFISFDCDPTKSDVVQPLVKYLGSCMRYTMVATPDELASNGIDGISSLVESCYQQICLAFSRRSCRLSEERLLVGAIGDEQNVNNIGSLKTCDWEYLAAKFRLNRLAKIVLTEGAVLFSKKPKG